MTTDDYRRLLEEGWSRCGDPRPSRAQFLSSDIFDFTLYDGAMDEVFGHKAVEVCQAILTRTTCEYIREEENYRWYLIMCNMPFFAERLEWGTSIRGAFWGSSVVPGTEFHTCALWANGQQLTEPMQFTWAEWERFIAALISFAQDTHLPEDVKCETKDGTYGGDRGADSVYSGGDPAGVGVEALAERVAGTGGAGADDRADDEAAVNRDTKEWRDE